MHPILGQPRRLAAYLALWLPLGVLLAALLALEGALSWPRALAVAVPLEILFGFLCLSAWYVARGLPIESTGLARVLVSAGFAALATSSIWLLFSRGWMELVAAPASRTVALPFHAVAPTLFGFGALLYLLAIAASYVLAAFQASQEVERRRLELQVLAREAELRALRAQIDPHFLFNSLQSISALTTADPAAARRMCLLLADFLRETLAVGSRDRIPLSGELTLAQKFLSVEQVRFGKRLTVAVHADGAERCAVPPLMLQPLVENAVTHGIAHLLEGGTIAITARRQGSLLSIAVENPCDPDRPPGRGAGVGLANVRERLRARYGSEASVHAEDAGGCYRVRIELPADDPDRG
jgi:two-component system sensor histidine kinase AlgZ